MKRIHTKLFALCLMLVACTGSPEPLPPELAGQALTARVEGSAAQVLLEQMHGVSFAEGEHLIGVYGPEKRGNRLYLTVYEDGATARESLLRMSLKMAGGGAVFSPLETADMGGKPRFRTTGLGFSHVFYRQGRIVVWLQWQPDSAAQAEAELLEYRLPAAEHGSVATGEQGVGLAVAAGADGETDTGGGKTSEVVDVSARVGVAAVAHDGHAADSLAGRGAGSVGGTAGTAE